MKQKIIITISGVQTPDLPSDFFDALADDIEADYDVPVRLKIKRPRRKTSPARQRRLTRLRVRRFRAKQKVTQ